ncbi:MAG: hypothetical protein NUV67_02265 [archaeon]|nr:hypothetical protein [archaeon]
MVKITPFDFTVLVLVPLASLALVLGIRYFFYRKKEPQIWHMRSEQVIKEELRDAFAVEPIISETGPEDVDAILADLVSISKERDPAITTRFYVRGEDEKKRPFVAATIISKIAVEEKRSHWFFYAIKTGSFTGGPGLIKSGKWLVAYEYKNLEEFKSDLDRFFALSKRAEYAAL